MHLLTYFLLDKEQVFSVLIEIESNRINRRILFDKLNKRFHFLRMINVFDDC